MRFFMRIASKEDELHSVLRQEVGTQHRLAAQQQRRVRASSAASINTRNSLTYPLFRFDFTRSIHFFLVQMKTIQRLSRWRRRKERTCVATKRKAFEGWGRLDEE
jgi:hypothetical protein